MVAASRADVEHAPVKRPADPARAPRLPARAKSPVPASCWRVLVPTIIVAYPVMLLFWPWAQESPIANPLHSLLFFSHLLPWGMYLAAARVSDPAAVIDHTLYWAAASTIGEARYLTAILNRDVLTQLVRPLQARGEHNPRHFDKYIFRLPISLYDPGDAEHRQLAELAGRAEEAAAALELPPGVSFQAQRRRIREALSRDGLGGEINNLTSALLAAAGQ